MGTLVNIWERVKDFHKAFNHPILSEPMELGTLDNSVIVDLKNLQSSLKAVQHKLANRGGITLDVTQVHRMLRMRLLIEEFSEYLKAEETNDMVEIADALGDIHYIAAGTEISYGIDGEAIFEEIQRSNMAKLDSSGNPLYDSGGKVIKPEGWTPPNIATVLQRSALSTSEDTTSV